MARLLHQARLHRPAEFDAAMQQGRRIAGTLLTAVARSNGLPHPRLGLALAKKNIAQANARNRIKRYIRESFRQQQRQLPPVDIVVFARPAAAAATPAALRSALEVMWQRIVQACAVLPSC